MTALPKIFFSIWEPKHTGCLKINLEEGAKRLWFKEGELAVVAPSLDTASFCRYLSEKGLLDATHLRKSGEDISSSTTFLAALSEDEMIPASQIWSALEDFVKQEIFALFDRPELTTSFELKALPAEDPVLMFLSIPELILKGVEQMQNLSLIEENLPEDGEEVHLLHPDHMDEISLEPHEKYLLQILTEPRSLEEIYTTSALGEKVTKKILFAFFCLGIWSPPSAATPSKPLQDLSAAELHRILDIFNKRCAIIFKYVSKELGPVAMNLLEKSLEEAKPGLSSDFRSIR
ncbi:MAG: DUF4388 domain-containing protein, partial [Candidatus Aminicenantales bacterium]